LVIKREILSYFSLDSFFRDIYTLAVTAVTSLQSGGIATMATATTKKETAKKPAEKKAETKKPATKKK
jgi:hypothetical protein